MESKTQDHLEQIKKVVESTPGKEITETLASQGLSYDEVLAAIFEMYRQSFLPERAKGEHDTFEFCIDTPDGPRSYTVVVDDGTCAITPGQAQDPTSVISMSLSDFLRMSLGKANGAMLAMTKRLKVSGDTVAAMAIRDWFSAER